MDEMQIGDEKKTEARVCCDPHETTSQRRIDLLEGRLNAALRDIHAMQMEMQGYRERRAMMSVVWRIVGSVVASISILIQIGRAVLL